jgi:hypothetical protein
MPDTDERQQSHAVGNAFVQSKPTLNVGRSGDALVDPTPDSQETDFSQSFGEQPIGDPEDISGGSPHVQHLPLGRHCGTLAEPSGRLSS